MMKKMSSEEEHNLELQGQEIMIKTAGAVMTGIRTVLPQRGGMAMMCGMLSAVYLIAVRLFGTHWADSIIGMVQEELESQGKLVPQWGSESTPDMQVEQVMQEKQDSSPVLH